MIQINTNIKTYNSTYLNRNIIQSATIQEKDDFYFFSKHIHQNIEVYYFIEGFCKMDIAKETITAEAGDLVMILPNTVHSFYLDSNIVCKFIHIHFEPSKLNSLFIKENEIQIDLLSLMCSITNYYKLTPDKNIVSLLHSILNEKNNINLFSEILCNLHLIEVLLYILKKENITSFFLNPKSEITPRYVLFAFEYIQKNYSEKILISDIANHLNISSRYLSKLFNEATNLTVLQYLNIYRINQAIDLMTNTDNSLTDISLTVGLGDIQHFSKLFKNIIGINPRKYKQLLIKQ